jgi:hydroxyacylglutathione hydrolase
MAKISGIPAFDDNYIWLLPNADGSALVVDPGDAQPVQRTLRDRGLRLAGILLTHHHFDHVGGVGPLKDAWACPVYGPANPLIDTIDHHLKGGDELAVGDYHFEIIEVPGHTLDHIAYYQPGQDPLLFCGDTLFAGGCGRIFEGDPAMMYASLARLAALPANTAVYCAHEYTLANLAFARAADPQNTALEQREQNAKARRASGLPTVPSDIALERATNPFLRSTDQGIRAALTAAGRAATDDPVLAFAALRAWKDQF